MSFITPLGFSKCIPAEPVQNIQPEKIKTPRWSQEIDYSRPSVKSVWDNSILSISPSYSGGFCHTFKAYVLDTSSEDKKSFDLILEDQVNDDNCEMLVYSILNIDLQGYAKPSTTFRIVMLYSTHASLVGNAVFN